MTLMPKVSVVDGDPIVLDRAPREHTPDLVADVVADGAETTQWDEPTIAPEEQSGDEMSIEPHLPAYVQTVSYEEYKERLGDELKALEDDARQRGLELGREQGRELGRAEFDEALNAFADLMESARAAFERSIDGIAELGVEVVFEAVAKIVGEMVLDKTATVAIVRDVIHRAKDRTNLIVRVSPRDWSLLKEGRAELLEGLNVGNVELLPDDTVEVGGCLLETPSGNLDGRLEVQLARLRDALLAAKPEPAETEFVA